MDETPGTEPDRPTDETGVPLTDTELAAVARARPMVTLLVLAHRGDDIELTGQGAHVSYRENGARVGRLVIERAVVTAAVAAPHEPLTGPED